MSLAEQIEAVISARDFGRPTARKSGRNPKWPWTPVIERAQHAPPFNIGHKHVEQIRGRAFATREEAVSYADRVIDARRVGMRSKLSDPCYRAFRKSLGLPEQIEKEAKQ